MTEHYCGKMHASKEEEEKCSASMHHKECCKPEEKFMMIAKEAWKELLKEKIKAEIEKNEKEHLEKLAAMTARASKDKWQHKMEAKMCYEEYRNELREFYLSKMKEH